MLVDPMHLPVGLTVLKGLTLIVHPFALAEPQLHLDLSVLEVEAHGDHGKSLFSGFADKLLDLALVEKELSDPEGVVVAIVCIRVRADVHIVDPDLVVLDRGIGVL